MTFTVNEPVRHARGEERAITRVQPVVESLLQISVIWWS